MMTMSLLRERAREWPMTLLELARGSNRSLLAASLPHPVHIYIYIYTVVFVAASIYFLLRWRDAFSFGPADDDVSLRCSRAARSMGPGP